MRQVGVEAVAEARWVSPHWWSNRFALRVEARTVASLRVRGSRGSAEIGNRRYSLRRFRWPPYISASDAETDELIVRFCLVPNRGYLAEFRDSESFRLGWVKFWKREWRWTSDAGDLVLASRRSWLRPKEVRVGPAWTEKWRLLAVLELAMSELSTPWF